MDSPPRLHSDRHPAKDGHTVKDRVVVLDGMWPGPDNPTLLGLFVSSHFHGNWESYSAFALWADLCLLEFPETPIFVDAWVPSKSPAVSSGGDGTAGGLGSNNMCNTTCSNSVASSLPSRLGGTSGRALFPSGDEGQRNIQSFFSTRKQQAAIEQAMVDKCTLLASKEAAHAALLIARQETFDASVRLKLVPQGKEVTWSPASDVGTGEDDTSVVADDLPPQRGTPHNSSARMTKVERLAPQLAERERIAAAASAHAASVRLRGSTIAVGTVSA